MNPTSNNKEAASADVESLSRQVALPIRPAEAVWQQEALGKQNSNVPGPVDYRLIAVLKYNAADARTLIEKVGGDSKQTPAGEVEVETWFPEEVKKLARKGEDGAMVEGAKYDPEAFLRAPYSSGKLVRVGETNYFVLKIFSF
ncbi:MAG TPA: hypothetical protein VM934_16490 [Pyrinomonadaceae bacterium]|nr:hypothetical protein [Pyrinomonadaceae bacterium]